VNRLEKVDRGDVVVDGQSLNAPGVDVNGVRTEIGVVFQSFNLFPHLSVLRNLTLAPMHIRRLDRAAAGRSAWSPRSCCSTSRPPPSTPR
jgi:polar amino acid transport system ATP-binding protein